MGSTLTHSNWQDDTALQMNESLKETFEVLKWTYKTYDTSELVYACSFGAEAIVLVDMISKVKKDARIVFLDTDLHFKATYSLINKVKERYPALQIEQIKPSLTLDEQAEKYGDKLWERDPNQCCHIRKVEPLRGQLTNVTAWISGLRREQSAARAKTNFINKDDNFKSIKVCPLIHWTWKEVWQYILLHELDYNVLHDQGYPSIGCEPCTLPVTASDDSRAGRWTEFAKKECGLHLS